ncbi:hypothetical protein BDZ89DRAFT_1072062 [Hymenopellis radicata]|nr:hypothetical protein BDZ89DRAFT_1072062 [Hymenopellis radicata]
MPSIAQEFGWSEEVAERLIGDYLNQHILAVFSYAIYTMLFAGTLRQIIARGEWHRRRIALTLVLCVIWALATVNVGLVWNALYATYVTHGQSQDAVLAYMFGIGQANFTPTRIAVNALGPTSIFVNAMLADFINIWRCWELYHRNWLVTVFPLLGVILGLFSHVFLQVTAFSSPNVAVIGLAQVHWAVVYDATLASVNALTTTLILVRIISVCGIKHVRTYGGLIYILVESAFLYSATYIVFLVLYLRDAPSADRDSFVYVQGILNAVTASAPTMIIGRVMAGESRPNDSWTHPSAVENMRNMAESIRFASNNQAPIVSLDLPDVPSHSSTSQSREPSMGGTTGEVLAGTDIEKGPINVED